MQASSLSVASYSFEHFHSGPSDQVVAASASGSTQTPPLHSSSSGAARTHPRMSAAAPGDVSAPSAPHEMTGALQLGASTFDPATQTYDIHADTTEVLFTKEQMAAKMAELGQQVAAEYQHKAPLIMPILKGGFICAADLVRALDPCPRGTAVEFVSASSYHHGTETSGSVDILFDEATVKDRHVLLVDDLCDSGLTLLSVKQRVLAAGASSCKCLVMLDKAARRKVDITPEFVGFPCPNVWVAGYGMDTVQLYRGLDYVAVLRPEAIQAALAGANKA